MKNIISLNAPAPVYKPAPMFEIFDGTEHAPTIPETKITCRVCGMVDTSNADAILLCSLCLEDIERTRAGLIVRRDAIFARMGRAETAWAIALTADPAVRAWWEQAQERPDLHEKALAAGGRGAALILAYRAFCAEFDACAEEKDRIHKAEREVSAAILAAPGVL